MSRFNLKEKLPLPQAAADSAAVIRRAIAGARNPLIAFSGGKDSIATALLCREQGVRHAYCDASFYFKTMLEDVERLGKELNIELDIQIPFKNEFFKTNPGLLFGKPKEANKLYELTHRRSIREYSERGEFDCVFFGRRLGENFVGDRLVKRASGIWHCFPLKLWTSVQTFNFVAKRGIKLPRLYNTIMGQPRSDGDWRFQDWPTLERNETRPNPFELVWQIDPDTVREVAQFNEEARGVVERNEQRHRN